MKKKLLVMVLALGMIFGTMGCGSNASNTSSPAVSSGTAVVVSSESAVVKDPVTITYSYDNGVGKQKYTEQVVEKLNEILKGLKGYEHITIDLKPYTKYAQNFKLAQASNEQIDLVSTYNLDFNTMVQNGDFIALEDLLEQFPNVVSEVPSWLVEMGKVFGKQYQIPTYQTATNMDNLQFPKKYLDNYLNAKGITLDDLKKKIQQGSMEDKLKILEDYVLTTREKTGKAKLYASGSIKATLFSNAEYIDVNYGSLILREGSKTPEWKELSDEYKVTLEYLARWYKEGLLHPDLATINEKNFKGEKFLNDEAIIYDITESVYPDKIVNEMKSATTGIMLEHIKVHDHYYIPSKYAAGGNAIYTDCEHPEEAMKIIELLMTKKSEEFYNTLVFGLEGIHYKWVDKESKRIETLEYSGAQGGATSSYHAYKWDIGNTFNAWSNQAIADGYNEIIKNNHESASTVLSQAMGFTWDLSPVADLISQCKAVTGEYSISSIVTSNDWKARYDEYVQKLKKAGVDDILAYLTKTYNEFLATK